MSPIPEISRRRFLLHAAGGAVLAGGLPGILRAQQAPAVITAESSRPVARWGLQIGDVVADRAIVWSRADRASRMLVDWSLDERFRDPVAIRGPHATDVSDFTARVDLTGLPPDEDVFVRVRFEELVPGGAQSEPLLARFRTAPKERRGVRFVFSGDTAGQGWGIDLGFGGMKLYEAMRRTQPDFFVHSGDNIYADGPLLPEVTDASGKVIWRNAFLDEVPEKLKVAESLHEFHRNYLYNRLDRNIQRFSAEVPQIWQWDDHETINNWSDSKVLDDRYTDKRIRALVANSTRAFLDYSPMRWHSQVESERVYRHVPYGRDLELFVLDMRSYRGPNGCNRETAPGPTTAYLGRAQIDWLKERLERSQATWKVIAADMPLGLVVADGLGPGGCAQFENSANGDGPVLGREFEIAEVLGFIKRSEVRNVVWITADVHYAAAHFYDPAKAQFHDFDPFWEFVAGPANAGTFGPNPLDNTFGPQVVFQKTPPPGQVNLPPTAGLQIFGQNDIDPHSRDMTVALKDIDGRTVFSQSLRARGG